MRIWLIAFLTALFVLGCLRMPWLDTALEPPVLRLLVEPRVALAPATFRASILVRPSNANRSACIQIAWQSSCWTINGAEDAIQFPPRWFTVYEPGDYEVIATVYSVSARVRDQVRQTVTVQ